MKESRKEIEKRMAKEVEKKVEEGVTVGTTILVSVAVTFVMSVVVFKFVWGWVVVDLFPGAVAQDLISADLTWLAAAKFAVLVTAVSGLYPSIMEAFKRR